ncbi:hypothetical protein [Klebsiella phage YC1]|uniref:hypothetical protein n=1 Tax=Klebsiella quasipneumoniae TaxID=1463165 RepID=UPI0023B0FDE9|nr:hypothetical protein [Klebsiella quasipneumoniae]WNY41100.1 hypothetical protein [Klebsiella phage YC1]
MKVVRFGNLTVNKDNKLEITQFNFSSESNGEPVTPAGMVKAIVKWLNSHVGNTDGMFNPIKDLNGVPLIAGVNIPIDQSKLVMPKSVALAELDPPVFSTNEYTFLEVEERVYQLMAMQIGITLTTEMGVIPGSVELIDVDDSRPHPDNVVGYCLTLENPPRYFLKVKNKGVR